MLGTPQHINQIVRHIIFFSQSITNLSFFQKNNIVHKKYRQGTTLKTLPHLDPGNVLFCSNILATMRHQNFLASFVQSNFVRMFSNSDYLSI